MQGSNGLNYNYLKLRKEVGSIVGGEPQLKEKALQERLSDTNKQAVSKRICSYKAITKETTKACKN